MEKKAKRISRNMAWLLAAALVFTLFPATALAADTHDVYNAADLTSAIISAASGDTIRLMASFDCTTGITIDGKALTFNLNGYTLNVSNSGDNSIGINVINAASLDITGSGSLNASVTGQYSSGVHASGGSYAKVSSTSAGSTYAMSACAEGANSFIEVTGDVTTSFGFGSGARAENGGHVKVYGNVNGTNWPTYATGAGSLVEVMGNVHSGWNQVRCAYALHEAVIRIYGMVTATDWITYAAFLEDGATVYLENVTNTRMFAGLEEIEVSKTDGADGTGEEAGYRVFTHQKGTLKPVKLLARKVSAWIDPGTGSFDKKTENQADVKTTAVWGFATTVTDVKAGGVSIGTDGSGNWSRLERTLTFTKEYLAGQPVGELELSVVFDIGSPQTFTIAIHDTTPRVVTFDPQGGTVAPSTKTVTQEEPYGALPTPAKAGYLFGGWYTGANGAGDKIESTTIVAITADQTLYAKWTAISSAPTTLTDSATGVTVSGDGIHSMARLTVSPLKLHPAGTCAACDAIRKTQKDGRFILGYDISMTPPATGELTIAIPVGSQYDGQNVTILHCINGRLETIAVTVANGAATFTVAELSPFAVVRGLYVPGEITSPPQTGDAAAPWGFVLIGLAACCMRALAVRRRRA